MNANTHYTSIDLLQWRTLWNNAVNTVQEVLLVAAQVGGAYVTYRKSEKRFTAVLY